jgi:hypothetical protein
MRAVLLLWILAAVSAIDPKVTSVSPNKGSANGGTRITITGVGFSTNYHDTGGNYVVIGEDSICESVWFLSSATRIVCDTPARAASSSYLALKIAVDGTSWVQTAADATTGFQFKAGYAGTLKSVHPISGKAGSVISLKGQGWDQNLGEIQYLAVASAACAQEKLNYFRPSYLAEPDSWVHDDALTTMYSTGHIRCRLSAHTAGSYPISMTMTKGNVSKGAETSRLSNVGHTHEFQIYGDVQSVSPSQGGQNGGTRLTITGQGFSDLHADNVVMVGEQPCTVVSSAPTKIVCETSARRSGVKNSSVYAGARGLTQYAVPNLAPSGSMAWHLWSEDISYPSSFVSYPGRRDGFNGEFLHVASKDTGLSAVLDLGANTLKMGRQYGISFVYRADAPLTVGKATTVGDMKLDAVSFTGTFEAKSADSGSPISSKLHFISLTATWLEISQIYVWDPARTGDSSDSRSTDHVLVDSRLEFSSANLVNFKNRVLEEKGAMPPNQTSVHADGLSVLALDDFKDNGGGHFSKTTDGMHTGVHQSGFFVAPASGDYQFMLTGSLLGSLTVGEGGASITNALGSDSLHYNFQKELLSGFAVQTSSYSSSWEPSIGNSTGRLTLTSSCHRHGAGKGWRKYSSVASSTEQMVRGTTRIEFTFKILQQGRWHSSPLLVRLTNTADPSQAVTVAYNARNAAWDEQQEVAVDEWVRASWSIHSKFEAKYGSRPNRVEITLLQYLARSDNGHVNEVLIKDNMGFASEGEFFTFKGCFEDRAPVGDSTGSSDLLAGTPLVSNSTMTPTRCSAHCFRFSFFGIRGGDSCFCGYSYGKFRNLPDTSCNAVCTGADTEASLLGDAACGGELTNSVYYQSMASRGGKLAFHNDWYNFGSTFQACEWAVEGSLCIVSGLARKASSGLPAGQQLGLLPPECRPPTNSTFAVSHHQRPASARIDPDGTVTYIDGESNREWLGLSGAVFTTMTDTSTTTPIAFDAAVWEADTTGHAAPAWFKERTLCVLKGAINRKTGTTDTTFPAVLATLPEGCRPAEILTMSLTSLEQATEPVAMANLGGSGCTSSSPCATCQGDCDHDNDCIGDLQCFQRSNGEAVPGCAGDHPADYDFCYSSGGSDARVTLSPEGVLTWQAGGDGKTLSLDGALFDTRNGNSISFLNNYKDFGSGYKLASYTLTGSLCVVSGLVTRLSSANLAAGKIAFLPQECRPAKTQLFSVSNGQSGFARIDVDSSGNIWLQQYTSRSYPHNTISLDGIKFIVADAHADNSEDDLTGVHQGVHAEYFYYSSDAASPTIEQIDSGSLSPDHVTREANFYHAYTRSTWGENTVSDYFAAKYTARLHIGKEGIYKFTALADDKLTFWLNGEKLIETTQGRRDFHSDEVNLVAGVHEIEIFYVESASDAGYYLKYEGPDILRQIIPQSVLTTGNELKSLRAPLVSKQSAKCLDHGPEGDKDLQMMSCTGANIQQWTYAPRTKEIKNFAGKCLEVYSAITVTIRTGGAVSAATNDPVYISFQGTHASSDEFTVKSSFAKNDVYTSSFSIGKYIGGLKGVTLRAGGLDAWECVGVSASMGSVDYEFDFRSAALNEYGLYQGFFMIVLDSASDRQGREYKSVLVSSSSESTATNSSGLNFMVAPCAQNPSQMWSLDQRNHRLYSPATGKCLMSHSPEEADGKVILDMDACASDIAASDAADPDSPSLTREQQQQQWTWQLPGFVAHMKKGDMVPIGFTYLRGHQAGELMVGVSASSATTESDGIMDQVRTVVGQGEYAVAAMDLNEHTEWLSSPMATLEDPENRYRDSSGALSGHAVGGAYNSGNIYSGSGWLAAANDNAQWYQMTMRWGATDEFATTSIRIRGVAIRPRDGHSEYVKTFTVKYSDQELPYADSFRCVETCTADDEASDCDASHCKIVPGNTGAGTAIEYSRFKAPIRAKYIRIYPQTWNRRVAMRTALLLEPEQGAKQILFDLGNETSADFKPLAVTHYKVLTTFRGCPSQWTLQGSHAAYPGSDDTATLAAMDWVDLHEGMMETCVNNKWWSYNVTMPESTYCRWGCPNPVAYATYRLLFDGNTVDGEQQIRLKDLRLFTNETTGRPAHFYSSDIVSAEHLRSRVEAPPVLVTTNGVLSSCGGDGDGSGANCAFDYQHYDFGITNVSPETANTGDILTIHGVGFNHLASTPAELEVKLGGSDCIVETVSAFADASMPTADSALTCRVASLSAGAHTVRLQHPALMGFADNNSSLAVRASLVISSIEPAEGSLEGGTVLTITGHGFSDQPFERCKARRSANPDTICAVVKRVCTSGVISCTFGEWWCDMIAPGGRFALADRAFDAAYQVSRYDVLRSTPSAVSDTAASLSGACNFEGYAELEGLDNIVVVGGAVCFPRRMINYHCKPYSYIECPVETIYGYDTPAKRHWAKIFDFSSTTRLECEISRPLKSKGVASHSPGAAAVTVRVGDELETDTSSFSFTDGATPTLTSYTPYRVSPATQLHLRGTNMDALPITDKAHYLTEFGFYEQLTNVTVWMGSAVDGLHVNTSSGATDPTGPSLPEDLQLGNLLGSAPSPGSGYFCHIETDERSPTYTDPASHGDADVVCTVVDLAPGTYDLAAYVWGKGWARVEVQPVVGLIVSGVSISPAWTNGCREGEGARSSASCVSNDREGSLYGGDVVRVTGSGFSNVNKHNVIEFVNGARTLACVPTSSSMYSIDCVTPDASSWFGGGGSASAVRVTVLCSNLAFCHADPIKNETSGGAAFSFSPISRPSVTSLEPTSIAPGALLTITGTGFTSVVDDLKVDIGGSPCEVIAYGDMPKPTALVCRSTGKTPGNFAVRVTVKGKGSSAFSDDPVHIAPTITSYELVKSDASLPDLVNPLGGTQLRVYGEGLGGWYNEDADPTWGGCYKNHGLMVDMGESLDMTVLKCSKLCKDYRFFALNGRYHCSCGEADSVSTLRLGAHHAGSCQSLCGGDLSQYCGGDGYISLWEACCFPTFSVCLNEATVAYTTNVCVYTSSASNSRTSGSVTAELLTDGVWSDAVSVFASAEQNTTTCVDVAYSSKTGSFPTDIKLTALSTDGWGYWKVTIDGVAAVQHPDGDSGYWFIDIGSTVGNPESIVLTVPSEAEAADRGGTGTSICREQGRPEFAATVVSVADDGRDAVLSLPPHPPTLNATDGFTLSLGGQVGGGVGYPIGFFPASLSFTPLPYCAKIVPIITSFEPKLASPGTIVTITGRAFGDTVGSSPGSTSGAACDAFVAGSSSPFSTSGTSTSVRFSSSECAVKTVTAGTGGESTLTCEVQDPVADDADERSKLPASCSDLLLTKPFTPTGWHRIQIHDHDPITVYCDMETDGGGYTFYPISNGIRSCKSTAANSCKELGMDIVIPRTKPHFQKLFASPNFGHGKGYLNACPGVSKPSNGGRYRNIAFHSEAGNAASRDWKATDGGSWYLHDKTSYSEPSGDYNANCWLGCLTYRPEYLNLNDARCNYCTTKYVCSTNDKLAAEKAEYMQVLLSSSAVGGGEAAVLFNSTANAGCQLEEGKVLPSTDTFKYISKEVTELTSTAVKQHVASAEACCRTCMFTGGCKGFTYQKSVAKCYLKRRVGTLTTATPSSDWVSGSTPDPIALELVPDIETVSHAGVASVAGGMGIDIRGRGLLLGSEVMNGIRLSAAISQANQSAVLAVSLPQSLAPSVHKFISTGYFGVKAAGVNTCGAGASFGKDECAAAVARIKPANETVLSLSSVASSSTPAGCSVSRNEFGVWTPYWNTRATGNNNGGFSVVCAVQIYSEAATPTIQTVVPSRGEPGTVITITGTALFDPSVDISALPVVTIGGAPCTVSSSDDVWSSGTHIECTTTAPLTGGGSYPVQLWTARGFAVDADVTIRPSPSLYTFPITVSSIEPNAGSAGGGTLVTITGSGFDTKAPIIWLGSSQCEIPANCTSSTTSSMPLCTYSQIVCTTGAAHTDKHVLAGITDAADGESIYGAVAVSLSSLSNYRLSVAEDSRSDYSASGFGFAESGDESTTDHHTLANSALPTVTINVASLTSTPKVVVSQLVQRPSTTGSKAEAVQKYSHIQAPPHMADGAASRKGIFLAVLSRTDGFNRLVPTVGGGLGAEYLDFYDAEVKGEEVAHLNEGCWSACDNTEGYCAWCGAGGACCRVGRDNGAECDGVNGGASGHQCVAASTTSSTGSYSAMGARFVKAGHRCRQTGSEASPTGVELGDCAAKCAAMDGSGLSRALSHASNIGKSGVGICTHFSWSKTTKTCIVNDQCGPSPSEPGALANYTVTVALSPTGLITTTEASFTLTLPTTATPWASGSDSIFVVFNRWSHSGGFQARVGDNTACATAYSASTGYFALVRLNSSDAWEFVNAAGTWEGFAPLPDDILVATYDFDAGTTTTLEGEAYAGPWPALLTEGTRSPINKGFVAGDMSIAVELAGKVTFRGRAFRHNHPWEATVRMTEPVAMANLGNTGCTPSSPCATCQGDCDHDNDCIGNLQCFQRSNGEAIPGCAGLTSATGHATYDFCYDDTYSSTPQVGRPDYDWGVYQLPGAGEAVRASTSGNSTTLEPRPMSSLRERLASLDARSVVVLASVGSGWGKTLTASLAKELIRCGATKDTIMNSVLAQDSSNHFALVGVCGGGIAGGRKSFGYAADEAEENLFYDANMDGGSAVFVSSEGTITLDAPLGKLGIVKTTIDPSTYTPYNYSEALTPKVTALEPVIGTTAGGTTITIEGSGFGDAPNVTLAGEVCAWKYEDIGSFRGVHLCEWGEGAEFGVNCTGIGASDTSITCITNPAGETGMSSKPYGETEVLVNGKGLAVTEPGAHYYSYLNRWSATTTWGYLPPPIEGDMVAIPTGNDVLYDMTSPRLVALIIEGTMVFADTLDLELNCSYILVKGWPSTGEQGKLVIGTAERPHLHRAVITLIGNRRSRELPMYGAKVLAVRYGIVDMHGDPSHASTTWSRLNASALAGDDRVTMRDKTHWKAGDDIVVAPTGLDEEEAEQRKVIRVMDDGQTLQLDKPLVFDHEGEVPYFEGRRIENAVGEVGLLTRNIVIQGDDDSYDQQYGCTVMFHDPGGENSLEGRFSHVEVRWAGQGFFLGRYAMHYHMTGNVSKSYVKSCSIYNSFNRALAIHGVHDLKVQKNVVYNIRGHAFFFEDGKFYTHTLLDLL